jgi:NAD(P)-dependent dehydrogenase (short-subunit alcohol dehydrogenase family)
MVEGFRSVAITGAAGGIGLELAREAVRQHASQVWLIDRDAAAVQRAADDLGSTAYGLAIDVGDRAAIAELTARWTCDTPDLVVNGAGVRSIAPIHLTTDEEWDATIAVNLTGTFLVMRAAASAMVSGGVRGVIVNIASIASEIGFSDRSAYCASKAGVLGMTKAAALDLAPHGIRTFAIAPGFHSTGMSRESDDAAVLAQVPLGRRGDPSDLARLILDVAASPFVTGTNVVVDGGALAGYRM